MPARSWGPCLAFGPCAAVLARLSVLVVVLGASGTGRTVAGQLGAAGFPRRLIVAGVLPVNGFDFGRRRVGSAFLGVGAGAFLRPLKGGLSVFP